MQGPPRQNFQGPPMGGMMLGILGRVFFLKFVGEMFGGLVGGRRLAFEVLWRVVELVLHVFPSFGDFLRLLHGSG